MNDMRQKLLPVFLEEAGRKILQLNGFIAAGAGGTKSLAELEAAFRAAHTLKGTAALVQAEAVRSLSGRIEGLLEGHFERSDFPSAIEYEAMELALDRLKLLIDAVANGEDEPAGLLSEADLALKLAMAMPGRKHLAEFSTSEDAMDPFAEDPDLGDVAMPVSASIVAATPDDPFADDPEIYQGPDDVSSYTAAAKQVESDPFAEDAEFDLAFMGDEVAPAAPPAVTYSDLNDPFSEDPALEYVETEEADLGLPDRLSPSVVGSSSPSEPASVKDESKDEVLTSIPEDSFIDKMRKRIETESPLQTAERLAKTLLSQNEGDAVARQYSCCRFRVAAKDYYLPIANMVEISDLPQIVHLPLAPAVVRGLINLRGQVLPVVDLGIQAGGTSQYVAVRKLVIAEAAGEKLAFLSDGIPNLSEDMLGEKVDVMDFVDQFRAGAS